MATLGKVVGSIFHGSQENQISLASLNFDFSLVKLDAPVEYQALGASLSPLRRESAEQGHSHVTARKLGALFQQLLPNTPKLLKAYGRRASEIAKDPRLKANPPYLDGVFPEHAGVDGTSIWAAATSGKGAIEMHLLACMLARMWSSSEATSLWVELLEERKREISHCDPSEPLHLSTMAAAQVHITREQLSEWDNSARSWLRTADEAYQTKQKQLMLIVDNLSMPINAEGNTYRSVLNAWLSALTMMEKILCGTAQRIESGAVLLGLSCWHLYPDLNVFGDRIVLQNDPLVSKNGVITIGVETSPAQQATGPYWSLPLAHLKHYGSPEYVRRTLSDDNERLTFDEYLAVALGSFLRTWDDPAHHIEEYSGIIITFVEYLRKWCETERAAIEDWEPVADSNQWSTRHRNVDEAAAEQERRRRLVDQVQLVSTDIFSPIEQIAKSFVEAVGLQRKIYTRLVKLGHRRTSSVLDESASLFGLNTHERLLSVLNSTEARVSYLRRLASHLAREYHVEPHQMCIVYAWTVQGAEKGEFGFLNRSPPTQSDYIFASALPIGSRTKKRSASGSQVHHTQHHRWLNWDQYVHLTDADKHFRSINRGSEQDEFFSIDLDSWTDMLTKPNRPGPSNQIGRVGSRVSTYEFDEMKDDEIEDDLTLSQIQSLEESDPVVTLSSWFPQINQSKPKASDPLLANYGDAQPFPTIDFKMFIGLKNSCALYLAPALLQNEFIAKASIRTSVSPAHLKWALDTANISAKELSTLILGHSELSRLSAVRESVLDSSTGSSVTEGLTAHNSSLNSLKALALVKNVYSQLPGCTIAMKSAYRTLSGFRWYRSHTLTGQLSRPRVFAVLVAMETGGVDLDPDTLQSVMAMASGDKIFLAGCLVSDPMVNSDSTVQAVRGNLGKPGVGLLIAPPDPLVRKPEEANWRVINHAQFDGESMDCFAETSLHLSLTNFILPIGEQSLGRQDIELRLLEAAVSVHDRGKWIGDLGLPDVLASCDYAAPLSSACTHRVGSGVLPRIVAVDNWDELLDPPKDSYVVRAYRNWLARLSAASLITQIGGRRVVVLPDKDAFCWQCVQEKKNREGGSIPRESCAYIC